MVAIKHPHTRDAPELVFDPSYAAPLVVVYVVRKAKYRTSKMYQTREPLCQIRASYDGGALLDGNKGYVVVRNAFDDLRYFDDFDTAKIYVHSLFALEYVG